MVLDIILFPLFIYLFIINLNNHLIVSLLLNILQVVLVANSLPALNDVTAMELPDIVAEAAKVCSTAHAQRPLKYVKHSNP